MNKLHRFSAAGAIIIALFLVINGCKKDDEDPIPVFTMSADTVSLVGGGKGLQFFAKCTNNGIKLGTVTITTPQDSLYIYQGNSVSYGQNDAIPMQGTNSAYPKKTGTWKFNIAGSSSGGTAFAQDQTLVIVK